MSPAMTTTKRIAILTGGGDVPGLNAVIKSVVYRATEAGYDGPRDPPRLGGPDPRPPRQRSRTRTTSGRSTGSTPGRSSGPAAPSCTPRGPTRARCAPPACRRGWTRPTRALSPIGDGIYDLTPLVLDNLSALGVDLLVTIGGDDTLSYSQVLVNAGVPLVAIPKTMDNDVQGTEYCIGFSTAITRAKEAINRQRTTLGSHERIGVFRIFGRDAGFSALYTAYVTSARCVIPEMPYDLDALSALLAADHEANPSHYAFVITAEGAIWKGAADDRRRRGRCLRASAQGQHRRGAGGRARGADRHRDAGVRADLRPPERRARFDRLAGRDDVRQRRDGPRRERGRPVGWSRSRTASTPTPPCPTRRSGRARWTCRRCTTSSASGRATTASSATRCCWSASTGGPSADGDVALSRPRAAPDRARAAPTCRRRRGRARSGPISSCAARALTGSTAPSWAARSRAMPRSLRWSATLNPSG